MTPRLVLVLIEGLPDTSMFLAMRRGGLEFMGWGGDRAIMAAVFDAIRENTTYTGHWKKGKPPDLPTYPRPNEKKKAEKKDNSVAGLFKRFGMRSGKH